MGLLFLNIFIVFFKILGIYVSYIYILYRIFSIDFVLGS